jgi:hypothetical protein
MGEVNTLCLDTQHFKQLVAEIRVGVQGSCIRVTNICRMSTVGSAGLKIFANGIHSHTCSNVFNVLFTNINALWF